MAACICMGSPGACIYPGPAQQRIARRACSCMNFCAIAATLQAAALPSIWSAEDFEARLMGEVAAEVQRQEVERCRQWLARGKPGGMSHGGGQGQEGGLRWRCDFLQNARLSLVAFSSCHKGGAARRCNQHHLTLCPARVCSLTGFVFCTPCCSGAAVCDRHGAGWRGRRRRGWAAVQPQPARFTGAAAVSIKTMISAVFHWLVV